MVFVKLSVVSRQRWTPLARLEASKFTSYDPATFL